MPQVQDREVSATAANKCGHVMLLALGANLASTMGAPAKTLREAIKKISSMGAAIRAVSSFYSTPAFPKGNGPDYVNAAAVIAADWTPLETLERVHQIEADLGRERLQRWGQRTLDLDLIACGDLVLPDAATHARWRALPLTDQIGQTPAELILPHPRLQDRAFVLVPLADVAPNWVHPMLGQSVSEMLAALPAEDRQAVKRLVGDEGG